jgi:hypothetical protein
MDLKYLKPALSIVGAGLIFYAGYLWGTYSMAQAYGEAMSAEAILYLAAKEEGKAQ